MNPTCQTCQFYQVESPKAYAGVNVAIQDLRYCSRYPRWSIVEPQHYCGEFMEKEMIEKQEWKKPELKELAVEDTAQWPNGGRKKLAVNFNGRRI